MKITIRVIVEPGDGAPATSHDVAVLAREDDLTAVAAGLRLDEAHQMLSGVQEHLVTAQAAAAVALAETCEDCGRRLAHKDSRYIVLRSLFGALRLSSPRFKTCPCRAGAAATFSPLTELLAERTTPELAYWEAKYAALASYGTAATLLTETFPLGRTLEATALRRRTTRTAQRLEADLGAERASSIDTCPAQWAELPRPDLPLVVGLDGGYVHSTAQTSRRNGWFEVIAGRSIPTGGGKAKCFAYTQTYDTKPRRRLYELLKSQGMQDNQTVEFFTDGGEDVRDVPRRINPQARHWLDWFHITMRITVLRNMARGLPTLEPDATDGHGPAWTIDPTTIDAELERVKNFLWHGNTHRAGELLDFLGADIDCLTNPTDRHLAFAAKLTEFTGYIRINAAFICNYGERHRCGETISSSIAESAVNQIISTRMVKKQQMRWSPRGAHLLLQLRTHVLNDDLADDFNRWYPGFTHSQHPLPDTPTSGNADAASPPNRQAITFEIH